MKNKFLLTTLLFLGAVLGYSQSITVSNTQYEIEGRAMANDYVVPQQNGFVIFDEDSCIHSPQAYVAGFYGNDYAFLCNRTAREKKTSLPQSVAKAQLFSYSTVNGDNSNTVKIGWKHVANTFTNSLEGYSAWADNDIIMSVTMDITGVTPGTNVTVNYEWNTFAAGNTEHENNDEDSVAAFNLFSIDGVEQLGGTHDFNNPPGFSGWNERKDITGSFNAVAGAPFTISVEADLFAQIDLPGKPYGFFSIVDQSDAVFVGDITLSVDPINPGDGGNTLGNGQGEFSLDIGSDTELSDPQLDQDEVFDPGDAYIIGGPPIPVGGINGFKDDAFIFGTDPMPTPPDGPPATTGAPTGSGTNPLNVYLNYFDLDGIDNLGTSLQSIQFVPGSPSLQQFQDDCIHNAEYIFLSYDDDTAAHYVDPGGAVAVNSLSPFQLDTFGQSADDDEIFEYDFTPVIPASPYFSQMVYEEAAVHVNMTPNPDAFNEEDDDVDALDFNLGVNTCPHTYFSADHEAVYVNPSGGLPLNPGSIYEVTGSGSIVEVVNAQSHIGLADSVDIDAFEFAWVVDTTEQRLGFGMLFSVDDDDPFTNEDESGGLDPTVIYGTFLNGSYFQFSQTGLYDDIDALATWENSLNGTPSGGTTGTQPEQPGNFAGLQVFPNPFTDMTRLEFTVSGKSDVQLQVLDATGKQVATLANAEYDSGKYIINWNGTDDRGNKLAAGMYVAKLTASGSEGETVRTIRMVLME